MKVFVNPDCKLSLGGAVVTIGSFDGVHYGHKAILEAVCFIAKERGFESTLITLFPHPRKVLGLDLTGFGVLNSMQEKEELIAECGVDNLVELEFTSEISDMNAERFAKDVLVDKLNAKVVVVGYNHHFGHNRSGSYKSLVEIGSRLGFEVVQISKHDLDNEKISSTVIRDALKKGDMERVNRYLGYNYYISAAIDYGGRVIISDDMKLLPKDGQYNVSVLDGSENRVPDTLKISGRKIDLLSVYVCNGEKIKIIFE